MSEYKGMVFWSGNKEEKLTTRILCQVLSKTYVRGEQKSVLNLTLVKHYLFIGVCLKVESWACMSLMGSSESIQEAGCLAHNFLSACNVEGSPVWLESYVQPLRDQSH